MGPLGGRPGFLSGTRRVPCRPRQGASVSPSSPPCPRLPRAGPGRERCVPAYWVWERFQTTAR